MSVKRDFTGKVVLITGSSSGIGAQTAIEFARTGAQVVINGPTNQFLDDVAKQCREVSPNGLTPLQVVANISKREECVRLIETTVQKFGKLDILVNNAGIGGRTPVTDEVIMDKFDDIINVNLRAVVYLTHLSVKHLEKTKGCIVNTCSETAIKPFATLGVYSASKAAVAQFTRCAALELGSKGIRVNAVSPAAVPSNLVHTEGQDPEEFKKFIKEYGKSYPMGRCGEPIDIANAIMFLASDESSWTTGTNLVVDGGAIFAPLPHFRST